MCLEQKGMPKALLGKEKKRLKSPQEEGRACTILYLKTLGHMAPGGKRFSPTGINNFYQLIPRDLGTTGLG